MTQDTQELLAESAEEKLCLLTHREDLPGHHHRRAPRHQWHPTARDPPPRFCRPHPRPHIRRPPLHRPSHPPLPHLARRRHPRRAKHRGPQIAGGR
eukprot:scaffold144362_cov27-Tisochrysis_lutea.AAC.1